MKHLGDAPTHALQREDQKTEATSTGEVRRFQRRFAYPLSPGMWLPRETGDLMRMRQRSTSEWRHSTGPQRTSIDACTPGPFRPLTLCPGAQDNEIPDRAGTIVELAQKMERMYDMRSKLRARV